MDFQFCPLCAAPLQTATIDEQARKQCSADGCQFVHWNNPTPVVAAIVQVGDDVILARNASWPEKMFGVVTGFLEAKEDPTDGVIREVKEELNLDAQAANLVGLYPFAQMNQLLIAYHVPATGQIQLNEELLEYKRIPITKLKPWPSGTGPAVADWLRSHG